jgi:hypothetical protein
MTITPLSNEERLSTGLSHKVVITHADLTDTDTAQALTLLTATEGQFVTRCGYKLVTDFASANGTGLTVSIGNGSSATSYQAAKELQGTEVDYWFSQLVTAPPTGAADQAGESEAVLATFTTSGGSSPTLAEYTAGELHIFLGVTDVKKL